MLLLLLLLQFDYSIKYRRLCPCTGEYGSVKTRILVYSMQWVQSVFLIFYDFFHDQFLTGYLTIFGRQIP